MYNITSATYEVTGRILVEADGGPYSVPDNATNKQRKMLQSWLDADEVNVIADQPDILMDEIRVERDSRLQGILKYFNNHPVSLPGTTTQAQWDTYLDDLRDLPTNINLTGVKSLADSLSQFPTEPS